MNGWPVTCTERFSGLSGRVQRDFRFSAEHRYVHPVMARADEVGATRRALGAGHLLMPPRAGATIPLTFVAL